MLMDGTVVVMCRCCLGALLMWEQWLWQCSGHEVGDGTDVTLLMVMTGGGSDSHISMVPMGISGGEAGDGLGAL